MGSEIFIKELERLIPNDLGGLLDTIFERLPNDEAIKWPERVVAQVWNNADLSQVSDRFLLWMLSGEDSPIAEWCGDEAIRTKHTQHLSLIHISEPTRPY